MEGEEEGEDVVWDALAPAVDGVESVRGVGSREAIGVVRLVDVAVNPRVVETAVDKVDRHVGAEEEQGDRGEEIAPAVVVDILVHLAVALSHHDGERRHEDGHERQRAQGDSELGADLLAEILTEGVYGRSLRCRSQRKCGGALPG